MVYNESLRDEIYHLLKLAEANDPEYKMFGVSGHKYKLKSPLPIESLRKVEFTYGITLPEDFFWFLTEVGNGGAGPDYGIIPLHLEGEEWKDKGVFYWYKYAKDDPLDLPIEKEKLLPKECPGLSDTVKNKVLQIYQTDESTACRIAALQVMIHFELPSWTEAMKEKLPQKEWVIRLSYALESKYGKPLFQYDPQINDWYTALVAALPAAVEASNKSDGEFVLSKIATMAVACQQYRIEDLLPYAAGDN